MKSPLFKHYLTAKKRKRQLLFIVTASFSDNLVARIGLEPNFYEANKRKSRKKGFEKLHLEANSLT